MAPLLAEKQMREWQITDTLMVGLFLIAFSSGIAGLVLIIWRRVHEPSLNRFNAWLERRGF